MSNGHRDATGWKGKQAHTDVVPTARVVDLHHRPRTSYHCCVDALGENTGDDGDTLATTLDGDPTVSQAPLTYTRGMNTRATMAWLRASHGEDGVAAVRDALPTRVLRDLGGRALRPASLSWVPFMAHARLLQSIADVLYDGDREALVAVGRASVLRDLPVLLRPVLELMSPGYLITKTTKLWNLYHSHGAWEITRGKRELVAVLVDRPESHPAFCATTRGMTEASLMMAGALQVSCVEERCRTRGAPVCSLRVTWTEKSDGPRDRLPRPPT